MAVCAGVARKVSIPFVVLTIIGWIIYVVGFALFNNKFDTQRDDIDFWPFWCFLITGPVLFINLIIYLITGRRLTGIITNFLTSFYLVHGGSILYLNGIILFRNFDADAVTDENQQLFTLVEWAGVMISVLFLTVHMMIWPLFRDPKEEYSYRDA